MNKEKFYEPSTNTAKINKDQTAPLPLMGRSSAWLASARPEKKRESEKEKESFHSAGSSCKKYSSNKSTSESHKVYRHSKGVSGVNMLRLVGHLRPWRRHRGG